MNNYSPFSQIFTFIQGLINTAVNGVTSSVVSHVSGPLKVALTLYVVLYGIGVLRGAIQSPFWDYVVLSMKLFIIWSLAANAQVYTTYVANVFLHSLPAFVQQVGNGGAPNVSSVDAFVNYGMQQVSAAEAATSWDDPGDYIVEGLAAILLYLAGAIFTLLLLIAVVPLALLIAIGPIFIACALFEPTRRFFAGWLSEAISFIVLELLISIFLSVLISLVGQQPTNSDPIGEVYVLVGGCIIIMMLAGQLPQIARSIAGGSAMGFGPGVGIVGAALKAYSGGNRQPQTSAAGGRLLRTKEA